MERVPAGHCRWSVQCERPPPADRALQDPEASFQETESKTPHPCHHRTAHYWSQATEMFPKV